MKETLIILFMFKNKALVYTTDVQQVLDMFENYVVTATIYCALNSLWCSVDGFITTEF